MESASYNNQGEITLSFVLGTDLDDALLRVSNKLNEVSDYPENADRPKIEAAGANSSPVIWMMLRTMADNQTHINQYLTFFEDNVRQFLERVEGVGSLFVFGGTENELHVDLDVYRMARYNITIDQIAAAITNANTTISAGGVRYRPEKLPGAHHWPVSIARAGP
jgi:HAE1 family hydrophobic/amphiphilic exporter-1